jgi:hypothetical protein
MRLLIEILELDYEMERATAQLRAQRDLSAVEQRKLETLVSGRAALVEVGEALRNEVQYCYRRISSEARSCLTCATCHL